MITQNKSKESFVPKKSKEILTRGAADGSVLVIRMDDDDFFYQLDGIAAEFWNFIDNKRSVETIRMKLIKSHRPPEAKFNRDVQKLLKDLSKNKLIES